MIIIGRALIVEVEGKHISIIDEILDTLKQHSDFDFLYLKSGMSVWVGNHRIFKPEGFEKRQAGL